jgi:sirohydrochlorin cobaltochelatase
MTTSDILTPLNLLRRYLNSMPLPDLHVRLNTILPEQYQDCFEELEPVSMGSAALKYDAKGRVAWDQIWGSFCNLAMAGGPPHKGTLLQPGSPREIEAAPERYRAVVEEACRGIRMACDLAVDKSPSPGWIQLHCETETMAQWILRAIVVENVSVRLKGESVLLPVGPHYRVEKEIKNVVTVSAKTSHYWLNHMSPQQHRMIGDLFARLNAKAPLLEPSCGDSSGRPEPNSSVSQRISDAVYAATGLPRSQHVYPDWIGVDCPSVNAAVWMMRALIASNVLSRRENNTLFIPLDSAHDPEGSEVTTRLETVHRLAPSRSIG